MGLLLLAGSCQDGKAPWSSGDEVEEESADEGDVGQTTISNADTTYEPPEDTAGQTEWAADTASGEYETPVNVDEGVKQWRLVISSMPTEELAERYLERQDEPEARIMYIDRLDTYRIVYGSYSNLREAQVEFERLSARYPDAWLVYF